jgi:hypothetical protein
MFFAMNKDLYYTMIFSFFWSEILAIYLSFLQLSCVLETTNMDGLLLRSLHTISFKSFNIIYKVMQYFYLLI